MEPIDQIETSGDQDEVSGDQGGCAIPIALSEPWPVAQETPAYQCTWHQGRIELSWLTFDGVNLIALSPDNLPLLVFVSRKIHLSENGYVHLEIRNLAPEIMLDIDGERVLTYTCFCQ